MLQIQHPISGLIHIAHEISIVHFKNMHVQKISQKCERCCEDRQLKSPFLEKVLCVWNKAAVNRFTLILIMTSTKQWSLWLQKPLFSKCSNLDILLFH